jgi:para-aminobenzoate synthetase / 4-amino-4-deoxychorismate lyase
MAASDWRPDPAQGIFETLLVVDGEPVELAGHLARFERSLREVYGTELPAEAREQVRAGAAGVDLGRLRLTAAPAAGGLALDVSARGIDPGIMLPLAGATLRRVDRPGGHGSHKWVDRRGMEHPDAGPGQLICDGDELLEAGWANLFAVRDETLWTPPADGRLLAGMARAAVLAIAREEGVATQEQSLHAEDLLEADEVFLTNSVRGIEPATSLDGTPLPGCGPLSRRLATALRRRWQLPDVRVPQAAATAPKAGQLSR